MFVVTKSSNYGRLGKLVFNQQEIKTPLLFPVVCLVTGTTARGGGLWKYILQADTLNGLLRRNPPVPLMSQVLHFLDFIPRKYKSIKLWQNLGIQQRYQSDISPPLQFKSPLFLDSGGFKLLWKDNLDLSAYELSMDSQKGFQSILELQRDLGGDFVATLDYPISPKLTEVEAKERMTKTLNNAIKSVSFLLKEKDWNPFLYIAVHGQNKESMEYYVKQLFKKKELEHYNFGLAIGSLVPLRGAKKYKTIIDLIRAVQDNIPKSKKHDIPIHLFGITGSLIPILCYLGIDSFDSSSYVQETRSLCYIDPKTRVPQPILEMEKINCNCRVCQHSNLVHIQESLVSTVKGFPVHHGHYKSKYYADIALHNLEMDFQLVENTREAIKADSLQEYLIEHTKKFTYLNPALDAIALEDESLRIRISRKIFSVSKPKNNDRIERSSSLKYKPNDFNVLNNGYCPSKNKKILLIIPCSGTKPYSQSRSHRFIRERLEQYLGKRINDLEKLTLSGLYGPIPEQYETNEVVMGYEFRLDSLDDKQIELLSDRLVTYLELYGDDYLACIGYATSKAYRMVLEKTAKKAAKLQVLPIKPKRRMLTEFYRKENIDELGEKIIQVLTNEV